MVMSAMGMVLSFSSTLTIYCLPMDQMIPKAPTSILNLRV